MEVMKYPQIKTVAIIAEGVPEQQTKDMIKVAEEKKACRAKSVRRLRVSSVFKPTWMDSGLSRASRRAGGTGQRYA
eukprot:8077899-Alexandrium_andersonii.AAC.1